MEDKERYERVTQRVFIVGLMVLAPGLLVLAGGLYGYFWIVPDERNQISEAAEEIGVTEIPGVSLDSTARFFALNIVIGSLMVAAGTVLTAIGMPRKRKMKET